MSFYDRFKRKQKKFTQGGFEIQNLDAYQDTLREYRRLREESRKPLPPLQPWQGPRKADRRKPPRPDEVAPEPSDVEEKPRTVKELLGETTPKRLADKVLRAFKGHKR